MKCPLQISVRHAGKLLGMDSEVTAYKHVPEMLQTIRGSGAKNILVPVSALANKLGCSFEHVWQAVEALGAEELATAAEREAKRTAEKAAAEKRRLELIDKRVDGMPAVVQASKAKAVQS